MNQNRIILFAKQPGKTSFSSLFTIKHALGTQKVGHTGTLDSFASGLLVVCAGSLTRLAGRITEFDKAYEAVIAFGTETDTLECTGTAVRTAPLPSLDALNRAVAHFSGTIMQVPPAFSAIHVNGKRASDLVRSGQAAALPARPVTIYESQIMETLLDDSGAVRAARVRFVVSKGTYIRSLARDIGAECGSAAHLAGLLRTRVGSFRLEDAAGADLLAPFTIESAFKTASLLTAADKAGSAGVLPDRNWDEERFLQRAVLEKALPMTKDFARECGFGVLEIRDEKLPFFKNGAKLHSDWFDVSPFSVQEPFAAVFTSDGELAGLLEKGESGYFSYSFVIH